MASPSADNHAAAPRPDAADQPGEASRNEADHPHNFDVQKDLHRRIRNDPDYDDWEYGTEPLPQEAWPASGGSEPDRS